LISRHLEIAIRALRLLMIFPFFFLWGYHYRSLLPL
jgi:hypothetical protein